VIVSSIPGPVVAFISATNVRKSFPVADSRAGASVDESGLEILKGVSLQVEKPETIAIMGRSGCGKSTFISLLAGLDSPSSGQIEVLGKQIAELSATSLNTFRARHVGIVFQQFHLLDHLTALENVRLPLDLNREKDSDMRAKKMLERVGLGHRTDHFPGQLSRGECQRVAIARVLVMSPEVLLADEPTGSLDIRTGREIIDLILQLAKERKMALIMTTHDGKIAERCDRIFFMDNGVLTLNRPAEFS
jgi:putative ABC transport system ATP-binding protein